MIDGHRINLIREQRRIACRKMANLRHIISTDQEGANTISNKPFAIATINSELVETKQSNADTRQKMDKANQSAQFYKKELEKRITKSRKIENTLKEKVKNKDEEIARLQRIINGEDQDDAAEQSDGGETPKDTL